MEESLICKTCQKELTLESKHQNHLESCKVCVAETMRKSKQEKMEKRQQIEVEYEHWKLKNGLFFTNGYFPCPNFEYCQTTLAPGLFYKNYPGICKKCFNERELKSLEGTYFCKDCKQDVPKIDFYTENRSRCKKCVRKYREEHRQFVKKARCEYL